ncbi:MAG: ABC transporter permease [Clostridiales bacterium]|nr:ABC transporter permease [Clostridiales bacterium]
MIFENILLAIGSLRANKMRSLLTMLGIIIGITSVIAIMTVGNSMSASVSDQLSVFGTGNISVYIQEKSEDTGNTPLFMRSATLSESGGIVPDSRSSSKAPDSEDLMTQDMIDAFAEAFRGRIDGVSQARPVADSAQARDGELYANVSVYGVNAAFENANRIELVAGRFINASDVAGNRGVAVVSEKAIQNMFAGETPEGALGRQLKTYANGGINVYTIVGVYKYTRSVLSVSSVAEKDIRTNLYIPVSVAMMDSVEKNFSSVTAVAAKGVNVVSLTSEIENYFRSVYARNEDFGVAANNMESELSAITNALDQISMAIALIAAISLLVGGIGVMNIMLVSVTERTREIGTRKALGARNSHIRLQFVTEAAIIAVIGGVIGIILGVSGGTALVSFLDVPMIIDPLTVFGTIVFSMCIGIFFGYYPANKAAKLNPIDALRYE